MQNIPCEERLHKGPVAICECLQSIPCNPCADACPRQAITVAEINDCPVIAADNCNGCGLCMLHCPGLAIFVVDHTYSQEQALVKIPFEFLPLPKVNGSVEALNRSGECVGLAQVIRVQKSPNKTNVLWLAVPHELAMEVRAIRLQKEQ